MLSLKSKHELLKMTQLCETCLSFSANMHTCIGQSGGHAFGVQYPQGAKWHWRDALGSGLGLCLTGHSPPAPCITGLHLPRTVRPSLPASAPPRTTPPSTPRGWAAVPSGWCSQPWGVWMCGRKLINGPALEARPPTPSGRIVPLQAPRVCLGRGFRGHVQPMEM